MPQLNPNYVPPLSFEECARSHTNKPDYWSYPTVLNLAQKYTRNVILFDLNNLTPDQFITKYNPPLI
jgi:hypothetical protein